MNIYEKTYKSAIISDACAQFVFRFDLYIYIYICTQKKHMLVNVSAKAFISITFPNKMEHTYRL